MTLPRLSVSSGSLVDSSAEVIVIGVRAGADGPEAVGLPEGVELATATLKSIGVSGSADELVRIPAPAGLPSAVALAGIGPVVDADALRYAAGSAARQLAGVESIALALPADSPEATAAILEGAATGAYVFAAQRQSPVRQAVQEITVHGAESADAVARAEALAEAVHTVRDLVTTPPNELFPASFADRARELIGDLPIEIEVLDEAALAEGGYGGILGVGQGSSRGPRLVVLRYAPAGAERHLALVGKGITFDSGGLSLKPAGSMVGMKYDMTGAASVLAATIAAARLALPVRITTRLCLAENLPSGTAIRPNDVLTIRGGRTVEVLNTDAEGRLVLADGLVAASEDQPDAIVDIATLTGAAKVALGERVVPIMGDEELGQKVVAAGAASGEPFWPMPLPNELRAALETDVADIANARIGNTAGGMLLAGVFLRSFIGRRDGEDGATIPWAHLDIAGAANHVGRGFGWTTKGSTGIGVRTLVRLAEDFAG
ncbi:leucyl aminopeptidase [Schumannella luteola]|uniref:Probable cytosol aminopeptidase n=1 Tax=Schumannella luteola TaxID=472059 RepID=A0A852YRI8_9MICO|nr:leucyl aminopeptidase [Schumannella luteola]NYG99865.1 leucyl aminopeptidase [Schumannella luteola]TPX02202.1 leucyl aminopeptidase [Schumannella luteola]